MTVTTPRRAESNDCEEDSAEEDVGKSSFRQRMHRYFVSRPKLNIRRIFNSGKVVRRSQEEVADRESQERTTGDEQNRGSTLVEPLPSEHCTADVREPVRIPGDNGIFRPGDEANHETPDDLHEYLDSYIS